MSDKEAFTELEYLLDRVKIVTELAAWCTLAAAERLRGRFTRNHHDVVLIRCGGNMSLDKPVKSRQLVGN